MAVEVRELLSDEELVKKIFLENGIPVFVSPKKKEHPNMEKLRRTGDATMKGMKALGETMNEIAVGIEKAADVIAGEDPEQYRRSKARRHRARRKGLFEPHLMDME